MQNPFHSLLNATTLFLQLGDQNCTHRDVMHGNKMASFFIQSLMLLGTILFLFQLFRSKLFLHESRKMLK